MGDGAAMQLSFDELNTLEMALTVYQGCLEQCSDGLTALQGEYDNAGRLLQRVLKALGREQTDEWTLDG